MLPSEVISRLITGMQKMTKTEARNMNSINLFLLIFHPVAIDLNEMANQIINEADITENLIQELMSQPAKR